MRAAARVWRMSDIYVASVHDDNDAMLEIHGCEDEATAFAVAQRLARQYDAVCDARVRVCDVMHMSETDIAYRLARAIAYSA